MIVNGLPAKFWTVTMPEMTSTFNDICFQVDLIKFALQIRGGLDERSIQGVFADEQDAADLANELLERLKEPRQMPCVRRHLSPWPNWYATQDSHTSVSIVNKETGDKLSVEPPSEWGRNWAWNRSEDCLGITICRTG